MTENENRVEEEIHNEEIPKQKISWRMDQNNIPSSDLLKEGNEWKFGSKGWRQTKKLSQEQKEQQKQKMKEIRFEKNKVEAPLEKVDVMNQINDTKELIKEMRKYTQLMEASTKQNLPEKPKENEKPETIEEPLKQEPQINKVEIQQQIQQQKQIISNNPIFKRFGIQQ